MNQNLKRIRELGGYFADQIKEQGPASTLKRTAGFVKRRFFGKKARFLPKPAALDAQRAVDSMGWPVISICVPLYNTPMPYLKELLDSVRTQTCPCWQLCLADASDDAHAEVGRVCAAAAAIDRRIRYVKIENRGISANTNAAAKLADGEYMALADHDDVLAPHAVYWMSRTAKQTGAAFLYSDEALFETDIKKPRAGHFKPDYAPEYLECCNYICHLAVFRTALFRQVGELRPACDGSQDHDLFLRLIEQSGPPVHVPKVLYYWRVHAGSTSGGTAAKPYVAAAAKRALADHLRRTGRKGEVKDGLFPSTYKVEDPLPENALVSILIPNKDHTDDLEKALSSIYEKTVYRNFEVIVIENNSTDPATFAYYGALPERYPGCRVVKWEGAFNYSAINNFGRRAAKGNYLLLLNNDVEVINGEWLGEMLSLCARHGVGAVGAMLYYPDDTIQHAGVIVGLGGYAGHSHKYARRGGSGYMFRASTVQDLSAVTAACLLVKAEVYDRLGGLDEGFQVAFNDVDFCLRIRKQGLRVVWTPYAQLYHYESKSRGLDEQDPAKKARFAAEQQRLRARHGDVLARDPYYSPGLTLDREDFSENPDHRFFTEDRDWQPEE